MRSRRGGLMLAALAALVGVVLISVALAAQKSAPKPHAAGRINPPAPQATTTPSTQARPTAVRVLGPSKPVHVSIPAIGIHSQVLPIGLTPGGALAVPQPGPNLNKAAWFENSPTPGQPGPSIIEGHVDSDSGPSVFFELGKIAPGDKIIVKRADGVTVQFTVNAVRDFQKSRFPTALVYGAKDLSKPALRLITCSDFNTALRHHTGNEVVFAHLTAVHRH